MQQLTNFKPLSIICLWKGACGRIDVTATWGPQAVHHLAGHVRTRLVGGAQRPISQSPCRHVLSVLMVSPLDLALLQRVRLIISVYFGYATMP